MLVVLREHAIYEFRTHSATNRAMPLVRLSAPLATRHTVCCLLTVILASRSNLTPTIEHSSILQNTTTTTTIAHFEFFNRSSTRVLLCLTHCPIAKVHPRYNYNIPTNVNEHCQRSACVHCYCHIDDIAPCFFIFFLRASRTKQLGARERRGACAARTTNHDELTLNVK